ncbi:MAG: hypothetical protein ABIJ46_04775 [bacterium]
MDTQLIVRLIELVKKTGDRLVLADPAGESAVVVMDLSEYEGLLAQAGGRSARQSMPEVVAGSPVDGGSAPRIAVQEANSTLQPSLADGRRIDSPSASRPAHQEANETGAERLTAVETGANIKREIGNRETEGMAVGRPDQAVEGLGGSRPENKPPVQSPVSQPQDQPAQWPDGPEDEARFYLEPIE